MPQREILQVPDVAPIADMLPVPTVTTPINAPSPSHERPSPPPESPSPLPIPAPGHGNEPLPIRVHEAPPSPSHPPYAIPPPNWIPLAKDGDVTTIDLPPPHEMGEPLSPVEPSPMRSETMLPPLPHESGPSDININEEPIPIPYEPSVRSRDYAYPAGSSRGLAPSVSIRSPQSRTSTRISEYDIVLPPKYERTYRQGVDRDSLLSRQSPYRESVGLSLGAAWILDCSLADCFMFSARRCHLEAPVIP